jgi:hypothetical protein
MELLLYTTQHSFAESLVIDKLQAILGAMMLWRGTFKVGCSATHND